MNGKYHCRKPDPLLMLVVAVTLGTVMSMAVNAAEPIIPLKAFQQTALLSSFDSDGYLIGRIADTGAGLHVSMLPPPEVEQAMPASDTSIDGLKNMLDVYMTVRLPW